MTSLNQASIVDLSARFLGVLLRPDQSGYDEVRRVHNGMIDRRPALIAGCLGNADIVDAVNFARTHGLELAVRGGGHNVAGRAVCDDGLMLDMSLMKGIHVDPVRRTARAQGGVTWREFNRETQAHGLATTGGVISTTGIAGLTLGGGLGWLMAKHGLAMDNLVSAEVVTASGDIVRASKEENADLFWGLQGGGGNFGAVSWLEYRLHPVGTVTSGLIAHPFDRARDVLKFFREITSGLPDDLTIFGGATSCARRRSDRRYDCVPLRSPRRSRGCPCSLLRSSALRFSIPSVRQATRRRIGCWTLDSLGAPSTTGNPIS